MGLADQAYQRADTLSGGQQQRVGIARALAQQPQLVLADEPVASLDFISADQVMRLLRQVYEEDGIMVIVNLHDLRVVRDYADRVIGLRRGEMVYDGPPAALTETVIEEIYQEESHQVALNSAPRLVMANEEV